MTPLEQLHLFLKFHFAPDSPEKREVWASCSMQVYNEDEVAIIVAGIIDGRVTLSDYELQMLSIVANPAPPTDKQWAERITWAGTNADRGAAHADCDRLLVNLVKELGYDETAAAWQGVDKSYSSA